MPHPKGSPEAKAWAESMKAKREAKKKVEPQEVGAQPETHDKEDILSQELADLKKQLEELKASQFKPQQTPQVNQQGSLVGTFEKYVVDPANYPDPRERLRKEPKLQPFAFDFNYELGWDISTSNYQTQDGISTKEPKFTLELNRIIKDEETGENTNKRYTVCRAIFHEDPQAAIVVARENNYPVDETNQKSFLDEMRYVLMRDWLLEAFYPPKSTQEKMNKTETVIGNTLVEVFEINSEQSETMPFSQIHKKL